jgi:hypothetical protein
MVVSLELICYPAVSVAFDARCMQSGGKYATFMHALRMYGVFYA